MDVLLWREIGRGEPSPIGRVPGIRRYGGHGGRPARRILCRRPGAEEAAGAAGGAAQQTCGSQDQPVYLYTVYLWNIYHCVLLKLAEQSEAPDSFLAKIQQMSTLLLFNTTF